MVIIQTHVAVEVQLHSFLSSELEGASDNLHNSATLPPSWGNSSVSPGAQ
jgi:hypothetical protein